MKTVYMDGKCVINFLCTILSRTKKKSNFDESFINIIMMIVINDTYLR